MTKINLFLYKFFLVVELLVYIFASIFCIWTTKLIKILFYLSFICASISCIYSFIFIYISFDLKFDFLHKEKLFEITNYLFGKINIFLIIVLYLSSILNYFNNYYFQAYIKNCPFTSSSDLTSNNSFYFEKRRCELYNIYMNSRYKYQYICSFNASENFKNDMSDDGFDKIICLPKINNTINNDIINKFSILYNNNNVSELFYCNRIDLPKKNQYIKDEYCNNVKDTPSLFLLLFGFLIMAKSFNKLYKDLQEDLEFRIEFLNEDEALSISENDNCSTDNEESHSNNISFDEENDENIIVENNEVFNIDLNIKDFFEKEKKPKLD